MELREVSTLLFNVMLEPVSAMLQPVLNMAEVAHPPCLQAGYPREEWNSVQRVGVSSWKALLPEDITSLAGSILTYQRRRRIAEPLDLEAAKAAAAQLLLEPCDSPAKMAALVDASCWFCIQYPPGPGAYTSSHQMNFTPPVLEQVKPVQHPAWHTTTTC
jgi:hypothetical protein